MKKIDEDIQYRTKKYVIKPSNAEMFNFCDDICYKAKNLRNSANYHIRQCFILGKRETQDLKEENISYLKEINKLIESYNEHTIEIKTKSLNKLKEQYKIDNSEDIKNKIDKKQNDIDNFKGHKLVGIEYGNRFINYNFLAYFYPNCFVETEEYSNPYRELCSKVSQQVLKNLFSDWNSFFEAIKSYRKNPNVFTGPPKIPKYKKKDGRIKVSYTNQAVKLKDNILSFSGTAVTFYCNELPEDVKIQEVRIVPKGTTYDLEIIYNVTKELNTNLDKNRCIAIDLGVSNLATLTNNIGLEPIIINGKKLKYINQLYNKELSKYNSLMPFYTTKKYDKEKGTYVEEKRQTKYSKRLRNITNKRNRRVKDYIHKASKIIVNYCLKNNIGTIIIGRNKDWQRNADIGKRNNQNFTSIPFSQLIELIKYKAEYFGIKVIEQEESYTSKASFIDNDIIPVFDENDTGHHKFSGKRIKRGLYKTANGTLINADVNGSLNIMKKFNNDLIKDIKIIDILKYPRKLKVA